MNTIRTSNISILCIGKTSKSCISILSRIGFASKAIHPEDVLLEKRILHHPLQEKVKMPYLKC